MTKIAIIGPHSAGKTTLINLIRSDLRREELYIPSIEEIARQLIEMFGIDWQSESPYVYNSLQLAIYYYYDYAYRVNKSFIADRCHLDCIAYSHVRSLPSYNVMKHDFIFNSSQLRDVDIYFYKVQYPDSSQADIQQKLMELITEFNLNGKTIIFTRETSNSVRNDIVCKIRKNFQNRS